MSFITQNPSFVFSSKRCLRPVSLEATETWRDEMNRCENGAILSRQDTDPSPQKIHQNLEPAQTKTIRAALFVHLWKIFV